MGQLGHQTIVLGHMLRPMKLTQVWHTEKNRKTREKSEEKDSVKRKCNAKNPSKRLFEQVSHYVLKLADIVFDIYYVY